jgi:ABC-type amino acid transport substrate-binding protein
VIKRLSSPVITFPLVTAIAVTGLTATASSPGYAEHHLPKAPSDLIFGARVDAAPLSYRDDTDWRGYSIDLCNQIFATYRENYASLHDDQKLPPERPVSAQPNFLEVSAVDRIDSLSKRKIDILCGATTVTLARMKHANFSLLTFVSGASIMKKKSTDSRILLHSGKEPGEGAKVTYVGCSKDMKFLDCTTTGNWVRDRLGSAVITLPKKSHGEAFEALQTDEAQFYIGDRAILEFRLRSLAGEGANYELAPSFLTYEPYAIAIAKDNDLLLYSANATLARLYREADSDAGINAIYSLHFANRQSEMLQSMYRLQALQ